MGYHLCCSLLYLPVRLLFLFFVKWPVAEYQGGGGGGEEIENACDLLAFGSFMKTLACPSLPTLDKCVRSYKLLTI